MVFPQECSGVIQGNMGHMGLTEKDITFSSMTTFVKAIVNLWEKNDWSPLKESWLRYE